jgi:glutaredoxin
MDVEVFTRDGCKSSRRVKEFLAHHDIGFVERNLSADPTARADHARIGYRGVPVIRAGERIICGFSGTGARQTAGNFVRQARTRDLSGREV